MVADFSRAFLAFLAPRYRRTWALDKRVEMTDKRAVVRLVITERVIVLLSDWGGGCPP